VNSHSEALAEEFRCATTFALRTASSQLHSASAVALASFVSGIKKWGFRPKLSGIKNSWKYEKD